MLAEPRTLTKAELAELLFERVGLNKREAKDIVDTFFEEIRDARARRFREARDSATSRCATSRRALVAIPRRARPFPSPRAAW